MFKKVVKIFEINSKFLRYFDEIPEKLQENFEEIYEKLKKILNDSRKIVEILLGKIEVIQRF